MLASRDPNTHPKPITAKQGGISVSGDDLMNLLQRPSGAASGGGQGAASTTLSLTSSLHQLKQESQHEIVALIPNSRQLTINFSNWGRLRAEGDADKPTLVISFLG